MSLKPEEHDSDGIDHDNEDLNILFLSRLGLWLDDIIVAAFPLLWQMTPLAIPKP